MYYIRFTYSGKMLESPNYLGRLARYFRLKYVYDCEHQKTNVVTGVSLFLSNNTYPPPPYCSCTVPSEEDSYPEVH
jgi:hypothetical protein